VAAIEDVNFLAPFKFYRKEPRVVTVEAAIHPLVQGDLVGGKQETSLLAECRLIAAVPFRTKPRSK